MPPAPPVATVAMIPATANEMSRVHSSVVTERPAPVIVPSRYATNWSIARCAETCAVVTSRAASESRLAFRSACALHIAW
jgi:hypothetical protein